MDDGLEAGFGDNTDVDFSPFLSVGFGTRFPHSVAFPVYIFFT